MPLNATPHGDQRIDLDTQLVINAARFCARRAAEELLEHRLSPARGHPTDSAAVWPQRPLARTANGEIYAGSAGRLMGELIARADDGEQQATRARLAVCSYANEFATWVLAALHREQELAQRTDGDNETPPTVDTRHELIRAAHRRLAVEARVASSDRSITADDIVDIAKPATR